MSENGDGGWTPGRLGIVVPPITGVVLVLSLVVENSREVPLGHAAYTAAGLAVLGFIVWLGIRRRTVSDARATIYATAFVSWLLFFGTFKQLLDLGPPHGDPVSLVLWSGMFVLLVVFVARAREERVRTAARVLFVAALGALLGGSIRTGFEFFEGHLRPAPAEARLFEHGEDPRLAPTDPLPDIYYLVPDRYGSETVLSRYFGFDNRPFLDSLRKQGFTVAERSRANYLKTAHSLASALNLSYLSSTLPEEVQKAGYRPLHQALRRSVVVRELEALGYTYVHIGSWWEGTRTRPRAGYDHFPTVEPLCSEFRSVLLVNTVLWPVMEDVGFTPCPSSHNRHGVYRLALSQLGALGDVVDDPRPTFTFAHVILPHFPFVVDRTGSYLTAASEDSMGWREAYLEQVRYLNGEILNLTRRILENASVDPVILIQSDEGPVPHDLQEVRWSRTSPEALFHKYGILTAVRLPGSEEHEMPADIGPVNLFRFVFDRVFDAEMRLLAERNFIHPGPDSLYTFHEVTDRLNEVRTPVAKRKDRESWWSPF